MPGEATMGQWDWFLYMTKNIIIIRVDAGLATSEQSDSMRFGALALQVHVSLTGHYMLHYYMC